MGLGTMGRLKNILQFLEEGLHFDISGKRKCLSSLDGKHRYPPRLRSDNGREAGLQSDGGGASGLALSETICSEILIFGRVKTFPPATSPGIQKPLT